jgi:hypothetical protein
MLLMRFTYTQQCNMGIGRPLHLPAAKEQKPMALGPGGIRDATI